MLLKKCLLFNNNPNCFTILWFTLKNAIERTKGPLAPQPLSIPFSTLPPNHELEPYYSPLFILDVLPKSPYTFLLSIGHVFVCVQSCQLCSEYGCVVVGLWHVKDAMCCLVLVPRSNDFSVHILYCIGRTLESSKATWCIRPLYSITLKVHSWSTL